MAACFYNTAIGRRGKGGLHIVQGQGYSIVETRTAEKLTRNVGDNGAKCQGRTATVCDNGLQTVQQKQRLKNSFA
jgi:hypothetical protein